MDTRPVLTPRGPEVEEITNPPHYTDSEIECIDAIREALGLKHFRAYCRGTAIAYIWRAERKGNYLKDLAKAVWYIQMAAGNDPRLASERACGEEEIDESEQEAGRTAWERPADRWAYPAQSPRDPATR